MIGIKTEKAIILLEKMTGKKVILKEVISIESILNNTGRNKKFKLALEELIKFKTMPVISEREYNKVIGVISSNIRPEFEKIDIDTFGRPDNKISFNKRWEIIPQANYFNFSIIHPQTYQQTLDKFLSAKKELEAFNEVSNVALVDRNIQKLKEYLPLVQEIAEIRKKVKSLKDIRQIKQREEIKGKTNPQIQEAVNKIADDFRILIEANQFEYFKKTVVFWEKKSKEKGTKDPYELYPSRDSANVRQTILEVLNEEVLDKIRGLRTYHPKSDDELHKQADIMARQESESFSFKMANKLGGLLPKHSGITFTVKNVHDRSSPTSNVLKFSINNDESTFYVQNQIVGKYSKLNTPFYAFPTTFHNLVIKGQRIKSPDELQVKQSLNQVYGA